MRTTSGSSNLVRPESAESVESRPHEPHDSHDSHAPRDSHAPESRPPASHPPRGGVGRLVPLVPLLAATGYLAWTCVRRILTKIGHPGGALDDAYIHFQYARAFAEGHPFRYAPGEPISSGATSFLWPLVLGVFHFVGFRGEALMWPAWALSFAALAATAYDAKKLAEPLAGRAAAIGAGAMVLAFGGFAWGAASGMEVVPFAWLLVQGARRASEWVEASPEARTGKRLGWMFTVGVAAPLMRPEGAIASLMLAAAVTLAPRPVATDRGLGPKLRRRAEGLLLATTAFTPTLFLLLLTGKATSSTAQVKLLYGNPYYVFADASVANARLLVSSILDGETWSAEFLPKGGAPIACAGLAATLFRGHVTKRGPRAIFAVLLALAMFVPCTYVTFLWNRLRYLWPFATGWFIGLACLARTVAGLSARFDARTAGGVSALVSGGFAGMLAVRLEWVIEDVAQSASGISRQQVALGHWAKDHLPPTARIGVNDTGAIAYFGDRPTFDIVGLTTPSEGRHWVGGAASRIEHYERLRVTSPASLPTHFIIYPEWMGCDAILGRSLHEAVVTDSTILGGQIMRVYEARYDHLGSGDRPWTTTTKIHDTVDVADLESETAHAYALLGARDGEQSVAEGNAPSGNVVVDGGRTNRRHERFVVDLPSDGTVVGIARVESREDGTIDVQIDGRDVGHLPIEGGGWVELAFEVPSDRRGRRTVTLTSTVPLTTYHYWFATRGAGSP